MDYLKPVQKELAKQRNLIEDYIDIEFHKEEGWIKSTIRNRWALGKRPDGSMIGLYASEEYAREKYQQNTSAGFGNVDLTLTGSLWKGIQISGFNNEYEIFSKDSKYEEIVDKYGEYNFNISDSEKKQLFTKIENKVLIEILDKTYAML